MPIQWLAVFADVAQSQVGTAVSFWTAVTRSLPGGPRGELDEYIPLTAQGEDPCLWIQRTARPDNESGWHLDLVVDDVDAAVSVASRLGASTVRRVRGLATLTSPAGLPFCLVMNEREYRRPEPRLWPSGQRSLLDQVCIDIPAAEYEPEARFWKGLTGWQRPGRDLREFELLEPPGQLPLRILLQRLGKADCGAVRAHVDLACDDVAAETRRHESLGAVIVRVAEHWTTLNDPCGLAYCITDRDPACKR
jgi:hypothetical protein